MRPKLVKIALLTIFYFYIPLIHAETIKVGGYPFPPFLEKKGDQYSGITLDLIEAMNSFQGKYQFEFVPTSSKRRYRDFETKIFDLIMFEDMSWGWQDFPLEASQVFFYGGEVYITQNDGVKDQDYFSSFRGKTIALARGYHYGFADFNADPEYLKNKFDVEISGSFSGIISKVHRGRTDLAVVTLSYLKKTIKERPELSESLLISDKFDQRYRQTMLLRDYRIGLKVGELNRIIDAMEKAGVLDKLWDKYGVLELKELGDQVVIE